MYQLASITLNRMSSGDDILVFAADILYCEALSGGGSTVYFRDGREPVKVGEAVSSIQTSVAALWTAYLTALTGV
jgi:hypothetical protein